LELTPHESKKPPRRKPPPNELTTGPSYSPATIAIAATILLVDMLRLVVSIFKLVLQQGGTVPLRPVTEIRSDTH
jgi:hypothetical protein